jgi:hypothetical protein
LYYYLIKEYQLAGAVMGNVLSDIMICVCLIYFIVTYRSKKGVKDDEVT